MAGHGVPTSLLSSLAQGWRSVTWSNRTPAAPSCGKEEQDEPKDLLQQNTKKPRLLSDRVVEALGHVTGMAFPGLPILPISGASLPSHEDAKERTQDMQQNPRDCTKPAANDQQQLPNQQPPNQRPSSGDDVLEQDQQRTDKAALPKGTGAGAASPRGAEAQEEDVVTPRNDSAAQEENDRGSLAPCSLAATMSLFDAQAVEQYLGSYEVQNSRPYQEDRMSLMLMDGQLVLGLFDGHAGQNTSTYLQEYLVQTVCQKMQEGAAGPEALQQSFMLLNNHLRRLHSSFYSGSTATVVLVDGARITCANAGDSPAFIVSKAGQATCLTVDHNPNTNDNERLRIQAAGGRIEKMHWGERYMRVLSYDSMSGLAMTRAFGDFNFIGVICDPHVCSVDAEDDAEFLVLASDGLTEQWDIQGAAEAVCEFARAGNSPREIATLLSQRAIQKGSRDNISVVVLDLQKYLSCDARLSTGA